MNKLKLAFFIDLSFLVIAFFFLSYGIFKSLAVSTPLSLLLSLVVSVIVCAVYLFLATKSQSKKELIDYEENSLNALSEKLTLSHDEYILNLLKSYFEFKNQRVEIEDGKIFLTDKNAEVKFDFNPDGTPLSTLINAYKKSNKKVIFIASKYSDSAKKLFLNKEDKIKLYTLKDLYISLKAANLLPDYVPPKKVKFDIKAHLKRENAKRFLRLGIIVILLSGFTYFSKFYIVFGSILIITALTLRFFKKPEEAAPIGIEA